MDTDNIRGLTVLIPGQKQIDLHNSFLFSGEIEPFLIRGSRLIMDLGCVHFMDSTGLGTIVSALRKLKEREGQMILCNATPAVSLLFEMVRIAAIVRICSNREEAAQVFLDS